jgi:hypothetical protein
MILESQVGVLMDLNLLKIDIIILWSRLDFLIWLLRLVLVYNFYKMLKLRLLKKTNQIFQLGPKFSSFKKISNNLVAASNRVLFNHAR